MKTLLELITIEMKEAFEAAGYDAAFAKVTLSNRPDLCEYCLLYTSDAADEL